MDFESGIILQLQMLFQTKAIILIFKSIITFHMYQLF